MAKACVTAFLKTEFAGGRHRQRVEKHGTPPVPARIAEHPEYFRPQTGAGSRKPGLCRDYQSLPAAPGA
jgi:hypothetical protein